MNQKWKNEINTWCAEIKQLEDENKMELLTNGLSDKYFETVEEINKRQTKIAITTYADWLTTR